MSVGSEIRRIRTEKRPKVTQEDLAKMAGIDRSYVGQIERGDREPSRDVLRSIAIALGVQPLALLAEAGYGPRRVAEGSQGYSGSTPPLSFEELSKAMADEPAIPVPIVDQLVHANEGAVLTGVTYIPKSLAVNQSLRAAVVRGDCMEPLIKQGDVIVVDLEGSPRPGDIIVALINKDDVQVKILKEKKVDRVILSSENSKYPDVEVSDINILGVVIEVNRKIRRY